MPVGGLLELISKSQELSFAEVVTYQVQTYRQGLVMSTAKSAGNRHGGQASQVNA